MKKLNKITKRQINDFIDNGNSIIDIINYLFTCDFTATEILNILVKDFKCNKSNIKLIFKYNYEIIL